MKILKNAVAGTLESSDLFIQIEPDEKELTLEIDSVVANQYMDSIRAAVLVLLVMSSFKNSGAKLIPVTPPALPSTRI